MPYAVQVFSIEYCVLKHFFVYLWLCWISLAACGLSLVAASGGCSLAVVCRLLLAALLLQSVGSRARGLRSLWPSGWAALRHIESSWSTGRIHVPRSGGGFLTNGPPGKSEHCIVDRCTHLCNQRSSQPVEHSHHLTSFLVFFSTPLLSNGLREDFPPSTNQRIWMTLS